MFCFCLGVGGGWVVVWVIGVRLNVVRVISVIVVCFNWLDIMNVFELFFVFGILFSVEIWIIE